MIGLAGAQRVGKTTLARDLALATGIPLVETGASQTFKRLGMDPKKDYPVDVRLGIQTEILADMKTAYEEAPRLFIADRTPLDFMAYMLADCSRESALLSSVDTGVELYFNRCEQVMCEYFKVICVVQPGIPRVEAEGKAPATWSYQEHINSIICGMVRFEEDGMNRPNTIVMLRGLTDRTERMSAMFEVLSEMGLVLRAGDQRNFDEEARH